MTSYNTGNTKFNSHVYATRHACSFYFPVAVRAPHSHALWQVFKSLIPLRAGGWVGLGAWLQGRIVA